MPSLMHGESLICAPQTPPASSAHFLRQWQGLERVGEGLSKVCKRGKPCMACSGCYARSMMLWVLARFLRRPWRDSVEQMQEIGPEERQQCVNNNI